MSCTSMTARPVSVLFVTVAFLKGRVLLRVPADLPIGVLASLTPPMVGPAAGPVHASGLSGACACPLTFCPAPARLSSVFILLCRVF